MTDLEPTGETPSSVRPTGCTGSPIDGSCGRTTRHATMGRQPSGDNKVAATVVFRLYMANVPGATDREQTGVGSYFVANYPPFSAWTEEATDSARDALNSAPGDVPLGLYLHIPFCRKRCHFCYFRVYTN